VARSTLRNAILRCGVIGLLNGVAGARPSVVAMTAPSPRFSPSMPPTSALTIGVRVGSSFISSLVRRTVCTGRQASRATALAPSAASSGKCGGRSGRNGRSGGSSRPAGVRSSSTVSSSAPDAPSMAAWWILVYTAARLWASPVIR